MKKSLISRSVILAALFALPLSTVQAATGCAAKQQDLQHELSIAREHGNTPQIAGLEKALREVTEHCTDEGLLKARQEKVAEKQAKVQEREQDLREAQATGRSDKIDKQQRKLEDAREELKTAQDALSQ